MLADRDYYPDRQELVESLGRDHLDWHVWERTEIENYLLVVDALIRLLGGNRDQRKIWEPELEKEFERLIEESRRDVRHRLVQSHEEQSLRLKKGWDASKVSREAERYLEERWQSEKLGLTDAKDAVLPALKRWCQKSRLESFSNRKLAESLRAEELPPEVHEVAQRLAVFAGVPEAAERSRPRPPR